MSMSEYVRSLYPPPKRNDNHYRDYKRFGYGVYLMQAYPGTWKQSGTPLVDIHKQCTADYNLYKLDVVVSGISDNPPESSLDDLLELFMGQPIVLAAADVRGFDLLLISAETPGVEIWAEDFRKFCVFLTEEGLQPWLCDEVVKTGDVFESWEDLE